jgi:hypothetical protein
VQPDWKVVEQEPSVRQQAPSEEEDVVAGCEQGLGLQVVAPFHV